MFSRTVSAIIVAMLLTSTLTLAFSIQTVETELPPLTVPEESAAMQGTTNLASQEPPPTEWNKTYGGTGDDFSHALVQTTDGGYALAGRTYSFGAGSSDFWLVKTDASGNMQWNRTYGGTGNDWALALVQTGDGGYALAGGTMSFGAGSEDSWLVKTDASGNMQWNRTYGGTSRDDAWALVQTSDGGYALAGGTESFGAGIRDFWLVKTDSAGKAQWNKTYGGTNWDDAYALVRTGDGGYALAGVTLSFGAGDYDIWLVKTDSAGKAQWNKTYGGTNWDDADALVQTSDGGYALAGETWSFGAGIRDFWLVKTDASGTMQWNRTYGGTEYDNALALVRTGDGGYALAGETESFGAGWSDFWLVKTDASGNMQWNRTYGGTSYDCAYALVQTSDGGYALAGYTMSFGAGSGDSWLVKVMGASAQPQLKAPWKGIAKVTQGNNGATSHYDHGTWDNTYALDVALPVGTDVLAPADGYVKYVDNDPGGGGGKELAIEHTGPTGKKFVTVYLHLSAILVEVGRFVYQGQVVAKSGDTGIVTGPHLHFHIWRPKGSEPEWAYDSHTMPIERLVLKQVNVDGDFREYDARKGELDDTKIAGKLFESNNTIFAVVVYTDKYTYHSGDTMRLGLNVTNPNSVKYLCFAVWITLPDSSTYLYMHEHSVTLPIGLNYANPAFQSVKLPSLPSGKYTWHGAFLERATHKTIVEDTAQWEFNVAYDRSAAYNYAQKYWDEVCSDGYFWNAPTTYVSLNPGTDIRAMTGYDCAHFVSCCIGNEPNEQGGGLDVPSRVPPTYGEPGAARVGDWLVSSGNGVEKTSVSELGVGDVINYDWDGDGNWDHVALYLGNDEVAAHTTCVWKGNWQLGGAADYRFIRIIT